MRARDVLPDGMDQGNFNGVAVRKGTVGAFLANARVCCDPRASADAVAAARRDIREALPALRALGLFEVLQVRDPALRAWIQAQGPGAA
ncbi:hypothetical protein [Achromobacter deleyi]|uniref:hypothetical protein n=1 Tax=Achromobacter deleyi TaxID=1353891 RepID=UPI001491978B|nr:hypothetical protein [Achromobacter deleyi]QVQ27835.1 hypothetical protein HLG70_05160 [Achromobacter deleyi]UIP23443.1 hypothetical protein LYZ39_13275 [Achromobacter deleyi]